MTDSLKQEVENRQKPQIKDAALRPAGILPKNMQAWVVLGIALIMVLVISLSGNKAPKEDPQKAISKSSGVTEANQARIEEYRNRIEEDARRLAAEQERLRRAQALLGMSPAGHAESPVPGPVPTAAAPQLSPAYHPREETIIPPKPERSAIERDRERREYESLFASNIAFTLRKDAIAGKEAAPSVGGPGQPLANMPQSPYGLFPATMPVLPMSQPQGQAAGQIATQPGKTPAETHEQETSTGKPVRIGAVQGSDQSGRTLYRILEGTILEAVLTNRLSGAFSGPVNCMITTDVYSRDGLQLLIPKGSRALGEVEKVDHLGQERLALRFHRIIMPDGYSQSLNRFEGLNQVGETGVRDKVDHHFARIFGVSLAIGALSGLSQYNTHYGLDVTSGDIYRQGVSRSLADSSTRILDRYLNILPSFTVREGHRVKIYIAADLHMPAYSDHGGVADK